MIWGALVGGLIGTLVLTAGLRISQEMGWTRMDLPLLLGTAFASDRPRAEVIGFAVHFVNGLLFALVYWIVFITVGSAGWLLGAVLGLAHALFAGGPLVTILLPSVHPRMGSPWSDAEETPLIEAPGFMLFNYGRATVVVTLVLHVVYGAIVGAAAAAAA